MMDDGFQLIVPKDARWDPKKRGPDFVNKLNNASIHLLNGSLEKLLPPKATTWSGLARILNDSLISFKNSTVEGSKDPNQTI